jgi:hypothetical protein
MQLQTDKVNCVQENVKISTHLRGTTYMHTIINHRVGHTFNGVRLNSYLVKMYLLTVYEGSKNRKIKQIYAQIFQQIFVYEILTTWNDTKRHKQPV